MTWLPTRTGQAIDLVEACSEQVDFDAIAWSLAHLNRYAGHGQQQVSVAQHTLFGLDLAPEELRPWWLLHDAPESRTGDLTQPAKEALRAIAESLGGKRQVAAVVETWRAFEARHELAIHQAAGLALPSAAQRAAIKQIDLVCLATEHRDAHAPSARPWAHEAKGVVAARRLVRFMPADKVADALAAQFRRHLPSLRPISASISAVRPTRRRA